jgi:tRNA A37 threonylcarbamoyltransferase TsaD
MVVAHSHLFFFYPVFGILALAAFYLPAVIFTDLYWRHLPYGKLRYALGTIVVAGLSLFLAKLLDTEPRALWEISPSALAADRGEPQGCAASSGACRRVPIVSPLADLRREGQSRLGLSKFARSCLVDRMLEFPDEMDKERYCFPAGAKLKGAACCEAQRLFRNEITRLQSDPAQRSLSAAYDHDVIATDLHPDYLSTRFAQQLTSSSGEASSAAPRLCQVQHHIAHALACIGENEVKPPVLAVVWDGTGYGSDHTVWGGEFMLVTETGCERVGHFRQFPLPGGDAAIQEPRRSALGLLFELYGESVHQMKEIPTVGAFTESELRLLNRMLCRKLNSPLTSSVGRLFDAVASLLNLKQRSDFEGQAAMALEFALPEHHDDSAYGFSMTDAAVPGHFVVDWAAVIESILRDQKDGVGSTSISSKFHNGLAECIVAVSRRVRCPKVALSGGCFQNRYFLERSVGLLRAAGFHPYWHQRVPPNDGGISFGQAVAALRGIV